MSFKDQINKSLAKGISIPINSDTYKALLNIHGNTNQDIVTVTFSQADIITPTKLTLNNLFGLFGGNAISSLVPEHILPLSGKSLTIQSVGFELSTDIEQITGLTTVITFTGLSLNPVSIIDLNFESLAITWSLPGNKMQSLSAQLFSNNTIAGLSLNALMSFPSGTISLYEPVGEVFNVGTFFTNLGILAGSILNNVSLKGFDFVINPNTQSFNLKGDFIPTSGTSITLIPSILSMQSMYFSFQYQTVEKQGKINASLVFRSFLFLDVTVAMDIQETGAGGGETTGNGEAVSWDFSGNINMQQTANKLGIVATQGKNHYQIPLLTIAEKTFDVGTLTLPPEFPTLNVSYLSIAYNHDESGGNSNNSYTLKGGIATSWSLAGSDLEATIGFTVIHDELVSSNNEKKINADFNFDGFDFSLGYDMVKNSGNLDASLSGIMHGHQFDISGSYNEEKNEVNFPETTGNPPPLKFPPLTTMMAWFVQKVSGAPYFELPEPWANVINTLFKDVMDGATFTINTKTKSVTYTKSSLSIPIFDLVTITSVTIGYTSPPKNKKELVVAAPQKSSSGLSFKLGYTSNILKGNAFEWDPVNEQPPTIPGKGAAIIDIQLLALGQHIKLQQYSPPPNSKIKYKLPPKTVEEAVDDLTLAVQSLSGNSSPAIGFSQNSGWLVGAHATFLGQADVKFIFDDPTMYGLSVKVGSGNNTLLNKLEGLFAEILYRKISNKIGEYEGFLTLPKKIRKLKIGNANLTLPSISVSIYTNGDYAFNIGFPYNMDFSHSFSVMADTFIGAGGFYYAKLDGLTPSFLPTITLPGKGVFNPITKIGVGLRVGRAVAFQKGPLSAKASISLEALFEGTFAKFTPNKRNYPEGEYYDILASVEIIGHIEGKVNFAIIQASLNAVAYIRVTAHLKAYEICEVAIVAHVSVGITVTIDLGFFSIHIHCHFSTTYQTSASLGSAGIGPWQNPDTSLLFSEAVTKNTPPPKPVKWTIVTRITPQLVNLDLIPQPSASGSDHWNYIAQFSLNLKESPNDSYQNFLQNILVWSLYAITLPDGTATFEDLIAQNSNVMISHNQIKAFVAAANNTSGDTYQYADVAPSIAQIQTLFGIATSDALLTMNVREVSQPATGTYESTFFPAIPGTSVAVSVVKKSSSGGKGNEDLTTPINQTITSSQQNVFAEFIMMTICNAFGKIQDLNIFTAANNNQANIYTIWKALTTPPSQQGAVSHINSIAGLTTRFMLHANQIGNKGMFTATGQEQAFTPTSTAKMYLSLTVSNTNAVSWGTVFNLITLNSDVNGGQDTTPAPILRKPSDFIGITLDTSTFTSLAYLYTHQPQYKQYPLKTKLVTNNSGQVLWQLPISLVNGLSSTALDPSKCILTSAKVNPKTNVIGNQEVPPSYNYATVVNFTVKKIPLPTSKGGKQAYVANTYQLVHVNQLGLLRLEQLIQDISSNPIANIYVGYSGNNEMNLSKVGSTLRILQSNFSTETHAPSVFSEVKNPTPQISPDFIYKLWTGGVTNSGGFYLYWDNGNAIASQFDQQGTATFSLVVSLNGTSPKPYATSLLMGTLGANIEAYISYQDKNDKVVKPYAHPSYIPVRISRNAPSKLGTTFANILNHTYNMLSVGCGYGNSTTTIVSPKNDPNNSDIWYYDHIFKPIGEFTPSGSNTVPENLNPYQYIINQTAPVFNLKPVDLFGNEWEAITPATTISAPPTYTDPVFSLKQLPHLHVTYEFDKTTGAVIIDFEFNFQTYGSGINDRPLTQQALDLKAYAYAIYQLEDSYLTTVITSKLGTIDSSSLKSIIQQNLVAIYKTIMQNVNLASPLSEATLGVTNIYAAKVFVMNMILAITRTKYVNSAFSGTSAVAQSVIQLPPKTTTKTSDKNSLKDFAKKFEEGPSYASQNMKIAVGPIDKSGSNPNAHQIWVVRYGASGDVNINFSVNTTGSSVTPVYSTFSPKPLSNQLLSRVVNIGNGTKVNANNVDLDAEMRILLAAIDNIFTPEIMVPATIINEAAVSSISKSKKSLVTQLIKYITSTQNTFPVSEALTAAQDLYKQECLIALSNFYKMDAVAVLEVAKNAGFDKTMNFEATIIPSNIVAAEANITNIKGGVPTNNSTYVAFGVFPKQLSKHKVFTADIGYKVTALEHNFEKVIINEGDSTINYNVGTWLKFVSKSNPQPIGNQTISIPLPLRAFPSSPRLDKLYAADLANIETVSNNADKEIMYAKSWSLNGSYQQNYVAQDSLQFTVTINQSVNNGAGGDALLDAPASKPDLLDTLVTFRSLYPTIKNTLNQLSTVTSPTQNMAPYKEALTSFSDLVSKVVTAMTLGKGKSSVMNLEDTLEATTPTIATFKVEKPAVGEVAGNFQLNLSYVPTIKQPNNPLGFLPQILIPNYILSIKKGSNLGDRITYNYTKKSTEKPENISSPENIAERIIAIAPAPELIKWSSIKAASVVPLDVLTSHNGIISMKILRNIELPSNFWYETAEVTYKSVLQPLLVTNKGAVIKMTELSNVSGTTITAYLTAFFNALRYDYISKTETTSGQFQTTVTFNYVSSVNPTLSNQYISLPVLMRIPTEFTAQSTYIAEIATYLKHWIIQTYGRLENIKNSTTLSTAFFNFDISLYSDGSGSGNPVLRVQSVRLEINQLTTS